jgi:hypothetical protein
MRGECVCPAFHFEVVCSRDSVMSGRKTPAVDPTAQAWARLYRSAGQQVHFIAPVAFLVVVGLCLNFLPVPVNYAAVLALVSWAAYTVFPYLNRSAGPSAEEKKAAEEVASELAEKLAIAEAERVAAEMNKQVRGHGAVSLSALSFHPLVRRKSPRPSSSAASSAKTSAAAAKKSSAAARPPLCESATRKRRSRRTKTCGGVARCRRETMARDEP